MGMGPEIVNIMNFSNNYTCPLQMQPLAIRFKFSEFTRGTVTTVSVKPTYFVDLLKRRCNTERISTVTETVDCGIGVHVLSSFC